METRERKHESTSPLLTDLYQLTMSQGFFHNGKADLEACFHVIFRDYPFNGGYAVACGIAQIAEYVQNFSFSDDEVDYLASIKDSQQKPMFSEDFLEYLRNLELSVDIDCVPEGTIVFPQEPVIRVTGPILQCQLLETAFLNCFNFQTLIATKAARVASAAGCPIMEFGLRRAQGYSGGIWASRAAVVGGCSSTSNALAGKMFDLPVAGTHAHSWVMSFENEIDAFRAYAKEFPNNCVLLVDTYDVVEGIKNAIIVGKEMEARGEKLAGIRIDSGDLSWLSKMARKMLDEAGLQDCGIVLSNDLDEYSIRSIRTEGGVFTSLGVGTKLATAYDQPALGGVFKLAASKKPGEKTWTNHMKISESATKMTVPGILGVRRYYDKTGRLAGDMIYDINHGVSSEEVIVDPADNLRRKKLGKYKHKELLEPFARNGQLVTNNFSVAESKQNVKNGLNLLDETQKRTLNPHTYPVGLEFSLNTRRNKMISDLRGIQ